MHQTLCIKLLFGFGVIDPAQQRLNRAWSPPAFPSPLSRSLAWSVRNSTRPIPAYRPSSN